MSEKLKFYCVKVGRKPGLYLTWEECSEQVVGYPGAIHKSFPSRAEAERYLVSGVARPSGRQSRLFSAIAEPEHSGDEDELLAAALPPPPLTKKRAGSHRIVHLERVEIYTDGGCLRNPGPGGYGVVLLSAGQRKELSGGFRMTTNNRMELTACIVGLEQLDAKCDVIVWTDSQYLVNSITKGWAKRWRKDGWLRQDKRVPNADLWQLLLDLHDEHQMSFKWIRGHAGNKENERCDRLAAEAMRLPGLPADTVYESQAGI